MTGNAQKRKEIGLAVVGTGTIGKIRSVLARDYPGVGWLGVCDINETLVRKVAEEAKADFWTTDYRELIKRSEVNATIVATDENQHVNPILAAVERGHRLFIEKPLATDVKDSRGVYDAIGKSGVDAVIGYTNRFRRRFLTIKERAPQRRYRRRHDGHDPGLHESDGPSGHAPTDQREGQPAADGGIGDPQPGLVHVDDGRKGTGRDLCPFR